ncbi:MAG: 4Fe-4S binding protein [Chloroflexota bacterium]|nr:4Fe-4S binding protein [Chloroflexota bacterium]
MQQQIPMPIIDRSRCDGCGLCVKACLHGALAMRGGKPVFVKPDACDYDGIGEMICPNGAIQLPYEIVYVDESED